MKKFNSIILILFFTAIVFGQGTTTNSPLDAKLTYVNQSSVTSGIIYERTLRGTDLYSYNHPDYTHNTADYSFFKQALFDLNLGSNNTRLMTVEALESINTNQTNLNEVNIGVINSSFQILNYNPERPSDGGLTYDGTYFRQISGKTPFVDLQALVIAPLKNFVAGSSITYKFSNSLILNNGSYTIKTLVANFGDGVNRTIINNGVLQITSVVVPNTLSNATRKITFNVTFSNNLTLTTYGKIFISNANISTTSNNRVPIAGCLDALTEDMNFNQSLGLPLGILQSEEPAYLGLGETTPKQARIEVRAFYGNGNTAKKLKKPVLILDGFDPGDTRKIMDCDCQFDPTGECQAKNKDINTEQYSNEEHKSILDMMIYKDEDDNTSKNFVTTLREKGFDVLIVNFPNGADFIERNALGIVTLIKKINVILEQNGSTEKISIIGPSMGGQISRYALAYMEKRQAAATTLLDKKIWNHNTKLWVAFDSPNHGANVPVGNQALLGSLSRLSDEAKEKYNLKMNNPAAKQQLIEFAKSPSVVGTDIYSNLLNVFNSLFLGLQTNFDVNWLNGATISQGLPTNSGNPFFQSHYNNQFNNGLLGSNGFPMNLRKIAIVNGSMTGKKSPGTDGGLMLDDRLFMRVCYRPFQLFSWKPTVCFTTKLATMQASLMPSNGGFSHSASIKQLEDIITVANFSVVNTNSRGNMDVLPGGLIDATDIIHQSIIKDKKTNKYNFSTTFNMFSGTISWENRALLPTQCFIPTFSGIGMKNVNQNWASPLNRNLLCNNETYFDSYFGEAENTEHVSLNHRSVKWVLEELSGNPQDPSFPLDHLAINGQNVLCENANATYTFNTTDPCKFPGIPTWSVSSGLQIVSSTTYTVTVKGLVNGSATITATFKSGQKMEKTIWVGKPNNYFYPERKSLCEFTYRAMNHPYEPNNYATYRWEFVDGTGGASINNFYSYGDIAEFTACPPFTINLKLIATNECGTTETIHPLWLNNNEEEINRVNLNNNGIKESFNKEIKTCKVYPNPANDIINIQIVDEDRKIQKDYKIYAELFDLLGQLKKSVDITDSNVSFSVKDFSKGVYVLKVYIGDKIETHKIIIE